MKYYLSVACMFRDEAKFLREWVEFHRLLGVEHFYLYDHRSIDSPEIILADYIQQGIVELERIDTDVGGNFMELQITTSGRAVEKAKGKSQWLALLDADEFINPKTTSSLLVFLKEYEKYGGLVMNWQMFGTSGVEEVPVDRTMIEMLTMRGKRTLGHCQHVKSIVQPLRVARTFLHFSYYQEPFYAVNTHHEKVDGPFDPRIHIDKLQLNHYFCRDGKFLKEVKIPRRAGLGVGTDIMLQWESEMNVEEDTTIQRFVGALKARMGLPVAFDWKEYAKRYPMENLKTRESAFAHWQIVGRFEEARRTIPT